METIYLIGGGIGLFYLLKDKIFNNENIDGNIYNFINNKDVLFIDVRSKEEYSMGHFKNSINIPYNIINRNIANDIEKLQQSKKVVIYCRSGRRAKIAFDKLKNVGLKNIYYTTFSFSKLNDLQN